MIDGEEYIVALDNRDGSCKGCSFKNSDCHCVTYGNFIFKKLEPMPRLMTNRELAEWLAKGNGQCKYVIPYSSTAYPYHVYELECENESVDPNTRIRPWGDDQWVNPTYDIYKRDCI